MLLQLIHIEKYYKHYCILYNNRKIEKYIEYNPELFSNNTQKTIIKGKTVLEEDNSNSFEQYKNICDVYFNY